MDNTEVAKDLMRTFQQFKRVMKPPPMVRGLKPSEMGLLFHIERFREDESSGVKVSELSGHMHVTSPSVTQLVKTLEDKGMVARRMDPDDRRSVLVSLTDKGEAVTRQAEQGLQALLSGIVDHLGEEKSKQLISLLDDVSQYLSTANNP